MEAAAEENFDCRNCIVDTTIAPGVLCDCSNGDVVVMVSQMVCDCDGNVL